MKKDNLIESAKTVLEAKGPSRAGGDVASDVIDLNISLSLGFTVDRATSKRNGYRFYVHTNETGIEPKLIKREEGLLDFSSHAEKSRPPTDERKEFNKKLEIEQKAADAALKKAMDAFDKVLGAELNKLGYK
jgi:hypothetical protein